MPSIVDYPGVLERMCGQGLRSLYFNSGAFGFPDGVATTSVGWIGPEDPTLRAAARELTTTVLPPFERTLARHVSNAWRQFLPGKVWLMPKSHWAYELDFGSRGWMPRALGRAGIDAAALQPRTNAAAIEFDYGESNRFDELVQILLEKLSGSDFALAFPGHPVVCTLHHHKQVWWTSTDFSLIDRLRTIAENRPVE